MLRPITTPRTLHYNAESYSRSWHKYITQTLFTSEEIENLLSSGHNTIVVKKMNKLRMRRQDRFWLETELATDRIPYNTSAFRCGSEVYRVYIRLDKLVRHYKTGQRLVFVLSRSWPEHHGGAYRNESLKLDYNDRGDIIASYGYDSLDRFDYVFDPEEDAADIQWVYVD